MIASALADRKLPVYGDGLNVRDWIHVEDHCRAVMTVLLESRARSITLARMQRWRILRWLN